MSTSLVELSKPSEKLEKSKDKLPLKPIQPTQYWTFDNVLTLLKDCQDPYLSDALDEFLLLNSKVFLDPSPFTSQLDNETLNDDTKDISLRSVLYTNITPQIIKDAKIISTTLHLELKEVVRVICQTNKKIPTRTTTWELEAIKSTLHDEKYYENKRLQLYIAKILRERRIVLRVVIELLSNKTNNYASSVIQNLGKDVFLSKDYIKSLIESIAKTTQQLVRKSFTTGISKDIDNTILNETILFCIEASKVLIELSVQNPNVTGPIVQEWFKLMKDTNFALVLGPSIKYHESFAMVHGLFTILCVQYLDLTNSFDNVNQNASDETMMANIGIFKYINDAIANTSNTNPVVLYSWSIILLRKFYFLQEYPSLPASTTFLKEFSFDHLENLINIINQKCSDLEIFVSLRKLNELLKFDKLYSGILSSLIIACMPLVTLSPDVTEAISSVIGNCPNHIIEGFFENKATTNAIIIARTKFPLMLTHTYNWLLLTVILLCMSSMI